MEYIGYFRNTVQNWSCPTQGTADLFNSCSQSNVGIPKNYKGVQKAQFGENYAGIHVLSNKHREYIQGKLSKTLIEDKKYKVSFYINLADKSDFAIKNIDFLFTNQRIGLKTFGVLTEMELKKSSINHYSYHFSDPQFFYNDKVKWQYIEKEITATGNEKFIVIGNFVKKAKTEKIRVSNEMNTGSSFYYIDMISVELINEISNRPKIIVENKEKTIFEVNKSYVFKNLTFKVNDVKLNNDAKKEIQALFNFLKNNKDTTIIISGHTDNVGTNLFNQNLSRKRAELAANYLIKLGLDKNRIVVIGYGNTRPIANNKTEIGRNKNRRVEFEILKNQTSQKTKI